MTVDQASTARRASFGNGAPATLPPMSFRSPLAAASVLVVASTAFAQVAQTNLQVQTLGTPAAVQSRTPRLGADEHGVRLSWIEERKTADGASIAELRFASLDGDQWSAPQAIARGDRWIVNWADFPAVAALDDKNLVAHYLERSGTDTYDYHVQLVRSADAGKTWNAPMRLHSDTGPGEHGFVSWAPLGDHGIAAVWLDGRNMKSKTASSGPMALYTRVITQGGVMGDEILLDERVCDCCQTAAVRASDGALLVAYRDRSNDEVRDISVIRLVRGSEPEPVWNSRDGWKIAGCPVNGPVLAVTVERVALVWFTVGSDASGRVLCAFSEDGGKSFSSPTKLVGDDAMGRVDAVFDSEGKLIVTWLETAGEKANWRVARIDDRGTMIDVDTAAVVSINRDSGLARLACDDHGVILAYTEPGTSPRVAIRRLTWTASNPR